MSQEKTNGARRGRRASDDDEKYAKSDYKNITFAVPTELLKEVEKLAKAYSERKFRKVTRAQALREAIAFAVRHWHWRQSSEQSREPSLL